MLTELLTITIYVIIFPSLQRNPILTRGPTSLSSQPLASTHITINLSFYSLTLDRTHNWHHAQCKLVTDLLDLVWCFWASLSFPDVSVLHLLHVRNVLLCGHTSCLCLHQLVALRWPPLLAHSQWCFCEHSCFLWVKCSFLLGTCWGALFHHMVHPCLALRGIVKLILTVAISFAYLCHDVWEFRLSHPCLMFIISLL